MTKEETTNTKKAFLQRFWSKFQTPTAPALMEDVDHVLASQPPEAAHQVLRGMVADLLRETETLHAQLASTQQELADSQKEVQVVRHEYQDQLAVLQTTLERGLGQLPDNKNNQQSLVLTAGDLLTPEQATELCVQSLSRQVEELHTQNTQLNQELVVARERMEDLESLNEARLHTIEALEQLSASTRRTGRPKPLWQQPHQPNTSWWGEWDTPSAKSYGTADMDLESSPERHFFDNRDDLETSILLSPGMGEI